MKEHESLVFTADPQHLPKSGAYLQETGARKGLDDVDRIAYRFVYT